MTQSKYIGLRHALAAFAILFGVATLKEGGGIIFGDVQAREAAGSYVPFVVWFNIIAGFGYLAAGAGILRARPWASKLAVAIAGATLTFFALLGLHILFEKPYEIRTVLAMSLRSAIWCGIAILLHTKRFRTTFALVAIATGTLGHGSGLLASELPLTTMPEKLSVAGKDLSLLGEGMHTVSFLKIKAFAAGFYLEGKGGDYKQIAKSQGIKHIRIRFLRSVGKERLSKTWKRQLHESCQERCEVLPAAATSLGNALENLSEGDLLEFTIHPTRVSVSIRGKFKESIHSTSLAGAMLAAWIGPKPVSEDVKAGFLGGAGARLEGRR